MHRADLRLPERRRRRTSWAERGQCQGGCLWRHESEWYHRTADTHSNSHHNIHVVISQLTALWNKNREEILWSKNRNKKLAFFWQLEDIQTKTSWLFWPVCTTFEALTSCVNSLSVALKAGYLSVRTAEGASEKQSSLKVHLRDGLTYLLNRTITIRTLHNWNWSHSYTRAISEYFQRVAYNMTKCCTNSRYYTILNSRSIVVVLLVVVMEQYPVREVDISIVLQQQVWDLNEAFFSSQCQCCETILT